MFDKSELNSAHVKLVPLNHPPSLPLPLGRDPGAHNSFRLHGEEILRRYSVQYFITKNIKSHELRLLFV